MPDEKVVVEPQKPGVETPPKTEEKLAAVEAPKTDDNGNGKDDEGLLALNKDQLVEIIRDTRGEAKTRRMKQRELEGQVKTIQDQIELNKQKDLETKQEWEKAYNDLKENTKDYKSLKDFKGSYIKECEDGINKLLPNLTKPELELFDLSKPKMEVNEQISFIKKLVENRPTNTKTDNTQSTGRGGQSAKDTVKIPFGNTTSVIGSILESLKAQRK